ncbi:MAG TPA: urate hydroxylase PuuD [Chloroflexota bacterium]|nr:urate hydroxylase PuuD [Chloroflexota bacterium]
MPTLATSRMEAYVLDWANLLVRWLHVTAAVAWIGTSFYYIALDYHLLPAKSGDPELSGEVWEIHGGGFYRVEKYRLAPATLPSPLHWFKWEAYTTWLSGFALLVVLYYLQASTYLIDRAVLDIAPLLAVGISVALLAVSWLVYDGLSRALEGRELWLAVTVSLLIAVVALGASQVFSPRAVYIQVGAVIGTWMAANVRFVIIPGQQELVAAKLAGREPEAIHGIRGKQRSVHNNYFTLPVLLAMISNHFPVLYAHAQGWLVLLALMALGAWVRHFFNLRHQGRIVWAIPVSAAAGVVLLALVLAPRGATTSQQRVTFAEAQAVIARRCVACHSATPTQPGFAAAPNGVMFDTPEQIAARASLINQRAVVTRDMPLGNLTGITDQERALLGAWFAQGASIP